MHAVSPRIEREDRGPATARRAAEPSAPMRRCIATREVRARRSLVRFVIGPGGDLVPDVGGRLPGRGLWLTPRRDIIAMAARKNLFAKAARQPVIVPPDLADRVEQLLVRRALDLLGLARRAGEVASGFEQVRERLVRGRAALLLAAGDAAAEGRRKLHALAPDLPVIDLLDAAELGRALGRDGIVHVAVAPGRLADRLRIEVERLAGMRARRERETDRSDEQ